MFDTVLLPLDQSPNTVETVAQALDLIQDQSGCLILLSVVVEEEQRDTHRMLMRKEFLGQTIRHVKNQCVNFEVIERKGELVLVICDVAVQLNVDVIVMGARGFHLNGDSENKVAQVIHSSQCPVLVVM
tara:strand:- start:278 stop:664 length:387 start_codon:yes stop_codon:yes gene_type:complete